MATSRLPNYESRAWALKVDPQGKPDTVHHFSDPEMRDGWVAMEPETRVAVPPSHPAIKRWLRQGKPSIWQRFINLF